MYSRWYGATCWQAESRREKTLAEAAPSRRFGNRRTGRVRVRSPVDGRRSTPAVRSGSDSLTEWTMRQLLGNQGLVDAEPGSIRADHRISCEAASTPAIARLLQLAQARQHSVTRPAAESVSVERWTVDLISGTKLTSGRDADCAANTECPAQRASSRASHGMTASGCGVRRPPIALTSDR